MTYPFPIAAIFWICFLIYKHLNKDAADENENRKELNTHRYIEYKSNERVIEYNHFYHYIITLDLMEAKLIDDKMITHQATKINSLINAMEQDDEHPISIVDIKAAKSYLLDRWAYITSVN
jgi:hypothetical protein